MRILALGTLHLALLFSGCASLWDTTDRWGVTTPHVDVIATRDIDINNDGVVDAREITERVRSELRPEVTRTVQDVARTYAPGPWGEIAAAGVGLLATILGVVSVRSRKRVVAA